jgi:hypothetical protein
VVGLPVLSLEKWGLTVGVEPSVSLDGSIGSQRDLLLICAGLALVFAILLLWTKRRAWGPLVRLLYAAPWSVSLAFCVYWWWVTTAKVSDLAAPDDILGQVIGVGQQVAEAMGILRIEPAFGLYLWSAGVLFGLVGLVVPGQLYEVKVRRR